MALICNSSNIYVNVIGTTDSNTQDDKLVNGVMQSLTFYTGNIEITVNGDFNEASVYCKHHGYMGGENIFKYVESCSIGGVSGGDSPVQDSDSSDEELSFEDIKNLIKQKVKLLNIILNKVNSRDDTSFSSLFRNNITGTNKEKRQKRQELLKASFDESRDDGENLKKMRFKKEDLELPTTIKKQDLDVYKPAEQINISEYKNSNVGFYCALDNSEHVNISLNNKLFTFTRNDDGTTERYFLTIDGGDWTGVTAETTASTTFNENDLSNGSNYLVPDDTITIISGDINQIFVVGSIGDGNTGNPANIFLTAGNRVYLDNTQSNTAANTALEVHGGINIKKDVWFGGDVTVADSGAILGDTSTIEAEEVVADSPLLLIGQNNNTDNLLSGYINRYKDNSSNFKMTGLVRNTTSNKPFLLVNDVNTDNSDKDMDITQFNDIATNTSNNYKNYYSSIYFTKLKGPSLFLR